VPFSPNPSPQVPGRGLVPRQHRSPVPKQVPAYGAPSAKAALIPFPIERRDPEPHDLEIGILYCGICHSDLHKVANDWGNTHFPVVPGHEIVGKVISRGSDATAFREGDLVGIGCIVDSCRVCRECRAGHEMFCEKGVTFSFDSFDTKRKSWTCGGYSAEIVVDERYVLRIPHGLDPARAAPLLCAGITTFSPLRQFGCKAGDRVAVVGLGGLGHMAVKFASSMGAEVTVLSTSPKKEGDALRLGAKHFVVTTEEGALNPLEGAIDLILDTVSGPHDLDRQATLLDSFGTMVLVGLPPAGANVDASALVHGNRRVAGSNIGGIRETQEMLDYSGRQAIVADIEQIRVDQLNEAYQRMLRDDVRYRFVVDLSTLHS